MDMPQWAVEGGLVLIGFVLGRLSVSRAANPGTPRTAAKDAVDALEARLPRS